MFSERNPAYFLTDQSLTKEARTMIRLAKGKINDVILRCVAISKILRKHEDFAKQMKARRKLHDARQKVVAEEMHRARKAQIMQRRNDIEERKLELMRV